MLHFILALALAAPVNLRVYPKVSTAPATIRVMVIIEPDAGNRKACLSIDGEEFHSTCWQLEGAGERKVKEFTFRIGAGGEYFALLRVLKLDQNGEPHVEEVTQQFIVTEAGVPFVR